MSRTTASAPGKLVLSGEYAVLDGAAAICMAVNRRARAVITDIEGDLSEISAPAFTDEVGRFESLDSGIRWQQGRDTFAVLDSVWQAVKPGRLPAQRIELDSNAFIDAATQRKTGIGSSAAITVALCAALLDSQDSAVLKMAAQQSHANWQGGAGSGVDVACSLSGGLIEYRMEGASAVTLRWPQGLSYRVIWTGVDASTRDKLATLDASISKPSRLRLASASETMAKAWRSGDAGEVIAGYRDYNERLRQFSSDHDLGIFDAGHDELWQVAEAAGLTYKPCGAGGGDVGVVFGRDDVELDAFPRSRPATCSVLDCEMSPVGVRIDR